MSLSVVLVCLRIRGTGRSRDSESFRRVLPTSEEACIGCNVTLTSFGVREAGLKGVGPVVNRVTRVRNVLWDKILLSTVSGLTTPVEEE